MANIGCRHLPIESQLGCWRGVMPELIRGACGARPLVLLHRLRECWLLGEDMVCITISISAGVCCAGGLDAFPLAGDLAVWKGKDGG